MIEEREDGTTVLRSHEDIDDFFSEAYFKKYTAEKRAKMNFFEVQWDRWRCRPYKVRLWRRFECWHWNKYHIPPNLKYFLQRAKRGWSDADVWNLYNSADRMLIGMLKELRDNNHGCPGILYDENGNEVVSMSMPWTPQYSDKDHEIEFQTQYDAWKSTLNAIISGLESMEKMDDYDMPRDKMDELAKEHVKAMGLLAHNWQGLWD